MNHFKSILVILFILLMVSLNASDEQIYHQTDEIVIAMCQPTVSQIKNIEQLYEKDIITLNKIKLIGIYHENESTDYEPAKAYVEENKLFWVAFEKITGKVDVENLFRRNIWTEQFKDIFDHTHGIIFTGGADIPPAVFGEEDDLLTVADTPNRCLYEVSFIFHLIGGSQNPQFLSLLETRPNYTVLGLCLGAQTLNVGAGGSLYQDIPSQVYGFKTVQQVLKAGEEKIHSSRYIKALHPLEEDLAPAFHRIKFKKSSTFMKRLKMKKDNTPYVLTSHHQTMKRLGKGLKVAATSMDGKVVEIIEHQRYKNVLGVQFHPEYYPLYQKGRYYKEKPGDDTLHFNLRTFLQEHPPSMKFHRAIWEWFSKALKE